jgi:hypothetical protein
VNRWAFSGGFAFDLVRKHSGILANFFLARPFQPTAVPHSTGSFVLAFGSFISNRRVVPALVSASMTRGTQRYQVVRVIISECASKADVVYFELS